MNKESIKEAATVKANRASQHTFAQRRLAKALDEIAAQGYQVTMKPSPGLCVNAHAGPAAWFCYHYNGAITPGTDLHPGQTKCGACAIAEPPYEEAPSWLSKSE